MIGRCPQPTKQESTYPDRVWADEGDLMPEKCEAVSSRKETQQTFTHQRLNTCREPDQPQHILERDVT